MGYHNPFEEDDGVEISPQELMAGLSGIRSIQPAGISGELIKIFGLREGKITVDISRENERGAERDATVLEAILSTTLEPDTMIKLCGIIYNKYIAPVHAQIKEQSRVAATTPRKRRARKDVQSPVDQ